MAYKFFNIGKANEEIERLEKDNAALTQQLKDARENADLVARNADELRAEHARQSEELATAKTDLKASGEKVTKLEADLKTAQDIIAKPDGEIHRLASLRAQEITAGLGIKPVQLTPANPNSDAVLQKYDELRKSDPRAAMVYYRDNKAAYDAAFAAKNKGK